MDIDKLILKALNKKASLAEYEALEEWKNESEQNIEYLKTMLAEESTNHTPYQQFDVKNAWNNISPNVEEKSNNSSLIALAILIIGLLLGAYLIFNSSNETRSDYFESTDSIATVNLEDNSIVTLNKNSSLSLLSDFNTERMVALQGEAFFEVTPNSERPFRIELDENNSVKVVGTSFNLLHRDQTFDLSVFSGVVELNVLNRVIELKRGDRITLKDGAYVKYRNNDENLISWKTNDLIFEDLALDQVFDELGEHFSVEFERADSDNQLGCTLRSRFTNQNLDEILLELQRIFDFDYDIKGSKVEIRNLECS